MCSRIGYWRRFRLLPTGFDACYLLLKIADYLLVRVNGRDESAVSRYYFVIITRKMVASMDSLPSPEYRRAILEGWGGVS